MISDKAYIDPSAKLGKNVTVHPYAYIDANVEIGDNCEIKPYASILYHLRAHKSISALFLRTFLAKLGGIQYECKEIAIRDVPG